MQDLATSMSAAAHGLTLQAARLRVTAENIANADTPGYHRKILTFSQLLGENDAKVPVPGAVTFSAEKLPRIHDPAHPMADAQGYYDGSNVDLMIEIADAREAQRSYEANLKMLDQARQMMTGLIDLLRR